MMDPDTLSVESILVASSHVNDPKIQRTNLHRHSLIFGRARPRYYLASTPLRNLPLYETSRNCRVVVELRPHVVFCVPRRAYRYNMAGVERNHVFS